MIRYFYGFLDYFYTRLDKKKVLRTKNLRLIPTISNRRGGKSSYAEWAHIIGIFQTLIFVHLNRHTNNNILDIGCGNGLVGIASEPFLEPKGGYVGIDVSINRILFSRNNYPSSTFKFIHLDTNNPAYAPSQETQKEPWPVDSESFDLLTALSVWTHLNEEDALFYIEEVRRVLRPGGKAIITFFLLDEYYEESLEMRTKDRGMYHPTPKDRWIFDQPAYGSSWWRNPTWAEVPETAIGITSDGLEKLISRSGLKVEHYYPGNWKEKPGVYFQDVLVFQKV